MYIRRLHASKISRAVAFFCVSALLSACSHEIQTDGGGSSEITTVTLSVNAIGNEQTLITKGMTTDQENAIRTLYILAFQKDGSGTFRLEYYATGTPAGNDSGKFKFTLRCSVSGEADTKLLLIANQNPYPLINTGMTYAEVQAALICVELVAAPAFADIGIPMFGFAGNSSDTPLLITDNMQLSANLLRAVARVDVGVGSYNTTTGEWDKGSVNFDLTHVHVFKPQNKYAILPTESKLQYSADVPSVTAPSPAGTLSDNNFDYTGSAITSTTYCKSEIYIPEVAFNGGTVYDAKHEQRTALVIGGTYNGKTNYYRIDFTNASTNVEGTALNDILRNHIYRYSITNVNQSGYATPEAAYSGKPVGLSFTASVTDWVEGVSVLPNPDMLVRMNFKGVNGTIVTGTIAEDGSSKAVEVKEKKNGFITDDGKTKATLNYNNLLGEAKDNLYNGVTNGGLYRNVQDAFDREGPYGKLVIAPDNAGEAVKWRSATQPKRVLDAKKACWDYRGQGHSDWRLPRLSELYLLWLNRVTINQSKGFISLDTSTNTTYWSGTEGGTSDQAYAVNADGAIALKAKTEVCSVRCVREVK